MALVSASFYLLLDGGGANKTRRVFYKLHVAVIHGISLVPEYI